HTRSYGDWSSDVCSSDLHEETETARIAEKKQREIAEESYQIARKAVDRSSEVSEKSFLLQEPSMQPVRRKLLESAREFYDKYVRDHAQDPTAHADLGRAYFRLAVITGEMDSEPKAIELHQQA